MWIHPSPGTTGLRLLIYSVEDLTKRSGSRLGCKERLREGRPGPFFFRQTVPFHRGSSTGVPNESCPGRRVPTGWSWGLSLHLRGGRAGDRCPRTESRSPGKGAGVAKSKGDTHRGVRSLVSPTPTYSPPPSVTATSLLPSEVRGEWTVFTTTSRTFGATVEDRTEPKGLSRGLCFSK